jgi:hypothetical protein
MNKINISKSVNEINSIQDIEMHSGEYLNCLGRDGRPVNLNQILTD